jgi:hypothetical protein
VEEGVTWVDKEKQIEEMAKAICEHYVNGGCGRCTYCFCDGDALKLYNAGYRKQSGWISVDERLPEESGTYITYHDHGNCGVIYYNASIHLWNVYYHEDKQNAIRSVTHWMPLPEPPDMKGGSE